MQRTQHWRDASSELAECLDTASFNNLHHEVEVSFQDPGGKQNIKSICWSGEAVDKEEGQPTGSRCTREGGQVKFSKNLTFIAKLGNLL